MAQEEFIGLADEAPMFADEIQFAPEAFHHDLHEKLLHIDAHSEIQLNHMTMMSSQAKGLRRKIQDLYE